MYIRIITDQAKGDYKEMAKKDFKKNTAEMFLSVPAEEAKAVNADQKETPGGFVVPKGYRLEKETKSVRLQLLVRPGTKEAIKDLAAQQGLSMNDLINTILEEYLERSGK